MAFFYTHLRTPAGVEPALAALDFADMEAAYLDACASLPELAAELLRRRIDPMLCALVICDADDRPLLEVRCGEALHRTSAATPAYSDLFAQINATADRVVSARTALAAELATSRDMLADARRLLSTINALSR